ncbi:hypothetical protein BDZ45DRAFT_411300 [Acephala macrosclerotiorum]|nr:hypothetical protein BDZ45DRAFT_411300 [Acephala macrosclerotiorum]
MCAGFRLKVLQPPGHVADPRAALLITTAVCNPAASTLSLFRSQLLMHISGHQKVMMLMKPPFSSLWTSLANKLHYFIATGPCAGCDDGTIGAVLPECLVEPYDNIPRGSMESKFPKDYDRAFYQSQTSVLCYELPDGCGTAGFESLMT